MVPAPPLDPGHMGPAAAWAMMPWAMPGMAQAAQMMQSWPMSNQAPAAQAVIPTAACSSDPPEEGLPNPYPTISNFLDNLATHHPKRWLSRYTDTFTAADFYNIDDIASLSPQELIGGQFELTFGNATFLLKEVKNEMKRIDRVNGKKRRIG